MWMKKKQQPFSGQEDYAFISLLTDEKTLMPHKASAIFFRHPNVPARYISITTSSTLLSRQRYRSMITVSKEIPLSLGILRVTSPDVVVKVAVVASAAVALTRLIALVLGSLGQLLPVAPQPWFGQC